MMLQAADQAWGLKRFSGGKGFNYGASICG
jgi:hypothetical protein